MGSNVEKATFGAGCFWGAEAKFRRTKGVKDATVGYMGGRLGHPRYEDVCRGGTRHTEVVQVTFNPKEISYEELLEVFWAMHEPTNKYMQDYNGGQYKSVVFYHDESQKKAAIEKKKKLNSSPPNIGGVGGGISGEIITEILPASVFYRAEETHQQYLEKVRQGIC